MTRPGDRGAFQTPRALGSSGPQVSARAKPPLHQRAPHTAQPQTAFSPRTGNSSRANDRQHHFDTSPQLAQRGLDPLFGAAQTRGPNSGCFTQAAVEPHSAARGEAQHTISRADRHRLQKSFPVGQTPRSACQEPGAIHSQTKWGPQHIGGNCRSATPCAPSECLS